MGTKAPATTPGANPHSWLLMNPDPDHSPVDFAMGVLERTYLGRENSASEFLATKLFPVPPAAGCHISTAERVEVALPASSDDRFSDPLVLAAEIDRVAITSKPSLLTYVTLYFPEATRLHQVWREAFGFAEKVTAIHDVATVAVLHAPFRAGSKNPVHAHLCLMGPRKLGSLGLGAYDHALCFPRAQKMLASMWADHRAAFADRS